MKSIAQKLQQLDGLRGTADVNAWEDGFIYNMLAMTRQGSDTTRLTEKQVEKIDALWARHFA